MSLLYSEVGCIFEYLLADKIIKHIFLKFQHLNAEIILARRCLMYDLLIQHFQNLSPQHGQNTFRDIIRVPKIEVFDAFPNKPVGEGQIELQQPVKKRGK